MNSDTIFVSIAAYMDPLLEYTINRMLFTAKKPDSIIFGLCIQDTPETLEHYKMLYESRENFRCIFVNHLYSKGCCWARAQVQTLYDNETYYMQLDAHHDFVDNWDVECINMLTHVTNIASKNPLCVLSTYAVPCDLSQGKLKITHGDVPFMMNCEKFYDTYKVRYVPCQVTRDTIEPVRWHTISAHFIFAPGCWVQQIPYDENLYFDGEEDSLALRSWTRGWDIFYPHKKIVYHYYIRNGAKRHTDFDKLWYKRNENSMKRFRSILKGENMGVYGLGDVRSLSQYTFFSGVDYENKTIISPEPQITLQKDPVVPEPQITLQKDPVHEVKFASSTAIIDKYNTNVYTIQESSYNKCLDFKSVQFVNCQENELCWNEIGDAYVCLFEQMDNDDNYYYLHDRGRCVNIKLAIDGSTAQVHVGSYNIHATFTPLFDNGCAIQYVDSNTTRDVQNDKSTILIVSFGLDEVVKRSNSSYAHLHNSNYLHHDGDSMNWQDATAHFEQFCKCVVIVYVHCNFQLNRRMRVERYTKMHKLDIKEHIYIQADEYAIIHKDALNKPHRVMHTNPIKPAYKLCIARK